MCAAVGDSPLDAGLVVGIGTLSLKEKVVVSAATKSRDLKVFSVPHFKVGTIYLINSRKRTMSL